jgi:hypothetical protein
LRKLELGDVEVAALQRNRPDAPVLRSERHCVGLGDVLVEETDGAGNEEREPDPLYVWTRNSALVV